MDRVLKNRLHDMNAEAFAEQFYKASHPKRIFMVKAITLSDARVLLKDDRKLPEGFRRIINNQFEELLKSCFPDHYCFYKRHKGCYYLEEIYKTLERYKERLDEKSTESPARRSLRESLEAEDYELLMRLIDAIKNDDFDFIENDIPQIKTYLFNEWLDILRFMQFYSLSFIKRMYEIVKELRLDSKSMIEWMLIADDMKQLRAGWEAKHKGQNSVNWLKFFDEELKDILRYGTTGAFFELLKYVSDNGVNVVRHGPYLEDLLRTIVSLKRLVLFRQLIKQYKISRFDWYSLIIPAANTGQIALIEDLMKLEENKRGFDPVHTRFQVMEASVKNGHFETFLYFFEQCTAAELENNPSWEQAIISAITWGNFGLFKALYENPIFNFDNIRPEISYIESKDDDKIKKCLRALTAKERLLQKTLAFDLDSQGSFEITYYLLRNILGDITADKFLNYTSDDVDLNKVMYLYTFTGRSKQYLNFVGAFLTTESNIRRFFYCCYFTPEEIESHFMPMVEKIHDSEYQTDKDALELFKNLATYSKYYLKKETLSDDMFKMLRSYVSESWSGKEEQKKLLTPLITSLQELENPLDPKQLYGKIMACILNSEIKIDEDSKLLGMINSFEAKIGHRLTTTSLLNRRIKIAKRNARGS